MTVRLGPSEHGEKKEELGYRRLCLNEETKDW